MSRWQTILKAALVLVAVVWGGYVAYKWVVMRVYVGPDEVLVVVNKFGKPLPSDRLTVPVGQDGYKGIQEEVLGPGRYFINPVTHDTKIDKVVQISAGFPEQWEFDAYGNLKNADSVAPKVGVVSLREGNPAPAGQEVVDPGFQGIQREVLTPGTYKVNPHRYQVTERPAVVVPPGSVGVVTRLVRDMGAVESVPFVSKATVVPTTGPAAIDTGSRIELGAKERGILKDVLQPGIYYLNPRVVRVTIVPIGYDVVTLEAALAPVTPARPAVGAPKPPPAVLSNRNAVSFYTKDGYQVVADFTVVWGRGPNDAPHIVASIGSTDRVQQNVIEPAVKATCQNIGANFTARELIEGTTRTEFQTKIDKSLEEQLASRHVTILLALVRNIHIKDNSGKDATDGLISTIQRANIEVERELTNVQKTETAVVKAQLEQSNKLVDLAKETVAAETNQKVAGAMAEGQKKSAEIDAQRELTVAEIQLQISQLEAKRTEILGKASAEVERLKNEAEAKGAKMLVDALGSPAAYNRYIFAKNFEPAELRLIFAGPGTFWTDLKTFQEIGASKTIQEGQVQPKK
jgi:hypothetical protein